MQVLVGHNLVGDAEVLFGLLIKDGWVELLDLRAVIIVSASGKENVGKENRGFVIFLSYIFLSAGLDGRNDDHGRFAVRLLCGCWIEY